MIENKNDTVPLHLEQNALPPAAAPSFDSDVLGKNVIDVEDSVLNSVKAIDRLEREWQKARFLEEKQVKAPHHGLRRHLGRLTGKSLRHGDEVWLESHGSSDIAERIRKRESSLAEYGQQQHELLDDVRSRIQNLGLHERNSLDEYLSRNTPAFLKHVYHSKMVISPPTGGHTHEEFTQEDKNAQSSDSSWGSWLGEKASDEQLTNFLQWHNNILAEQNDDPEFAELVERERAAYKLAIRRGIDEGWLHEDAKAAIEAVDNVRVLIGDAFDTIIAGRGGYHRTGSDYVVIAQGSGTNSASRRNELFFNVEHALLHEWNHAVLGDLGDTWLNEALTEHIARSIKFGKPDVVQPAAREDATGIGSYKARRMLLDTVLTKGSRRVPVALATNLYSRDDSGKEREDGEFYRVLRESWGKESVMSKVSRHVARLQKMYIERGKSPMKAQELAARKARLDLLIKPDVVFGKSYEITDSQLQVA